MSHDADAYVTEDCLRKYEAFNPNKDTVMQSESGELLHLKSSIEKVRSKDAWLTQYGRVIETEESPVKLVSLPKKKSDIDTRQQPLYGFWQTKPYSPPEVIDVHNHLYF